MLRESQRKLLEFLKESEAAKQRFTLEDASNASGLKESTVQTYIAKKLIDKWVFSLGNGNYKASDIANVSHQEFATVMSQKLAPPIRGYSDWRERLESLIFEGIGEKFPVEDTLLEIAASIEDSEQK